MPMLDIQRRHAEVFRIRLGDKDGNRPRKLTDSIRVTSPSQAVVQAFCDVYGGAVQPWSGGEGAQHEAYLPTTELSIMVLPGQSLAQWWELYRGSVCERRCDGFTEQLSGQPCKCPADLAIRMATKPGEACRPMTRVNVICPDVDVVGAGGLVTHGMIAAETLPQSIAVAEAALARGLMVPAVLRVVEHKGKKHFIVPQIEIVGVSLQALASGEVNHGALASGSPAAIGAPAQAAIGPAPVKAAPAKAAAKKTAPARPVVGEMPPLPGEDEAPSVQPAAHRAAPAASNGGGPVCAECGGSLLGCAVKIESGRKIHAGGCPTDSGPDDPGVTDGDSRESQHDGPSDDGPRAEPENAEVADPAASAAPADEEQIYSDRDIAMLAAEVFRPAYDAAPRGDKTKTQDRLRHAMVWAVTKGRTVHLAELTAKEKHLVWMELSWLRDGFNTWEHTPDALVITHVNDGREVVIAYTDIEETTAA